MAIIQLTVFKIKQRQSSQVEKTGKNKVSIMSKPHAHLHTIQEYTCKNFQNISIKV